jgi:hypothetical protein
VAVSLLCNGVGSRSTVDYFLVALPILELAHVLYVFFKIRYRPAVRAEEVGPCGAV